MKYKNSHAYVVGVSHTERINQVRLLGVGPTFYLLSKLPCLLLSIINQRLYLSQLKAQWLPSDS